MCREQRVCEGYLFQHFMNRRGVQKWEREGLCFSRTHEREGVGGPAAQPHIPVTGLHEERTTLLHIIMD